MFDTYHSLGGLDPNFRSRANRAQVRKSATDRVAVSTTKDRRGGAEIKTCERGGIGNRGSASKVEVISVARKRMSSTDLTVRRGEPSIVERWRGEEGKQAVSVGVIDPICFSIWSTIREKSGRSHDGIMVATVPEIAAEAHEAPETTRAYLEFLISRGAIARVRSVTGKPGYAAAIPADQE